MKRCTARPKRKTCLASRMRRAMSWVYWPAREVENDNATTFERRGEWKKVALSFELSFYPVFQINGN